ncbi:F-box only protein 6 [Phtheirospermum japonicum]|uniref:F-box only protein 6 n=1 Tax=Phtheirospermum japonicum TaxID=374723 RepID=A0A830C7L3_9LAMI|nr:F-box only protein 6 [Phtheirospermum japonicum]
MWSNLPFDLLAIIFTYLSPDSLARAKAACRNWRTTAESLTTSAARRRHPPWFIALPTPRSWAFSCYAHNPIANNWHCLPLDHTIIPFKPIATIGGLILLKITNTTSLQLAICNPFTKQFKRLPDLNFSRTNPAVGIVENNSLSNRNMGFKIYVAGGMSGATTGGGAIYQPTIEIYDSFSEIWEIIGKAMPFEIAVRLTVWTPNESVYSNGTLYWMTSARAYSVMGLDIFTNTWRELSVPLADKLEFAALVPRNGRLAVVGGRDGCVWELGDDDEWSLIGKVPIELGIRFLGNWGSVKCAGIEGAVCLYKDFGSGIVVWRDVFGEGKWEWDWIDGCCAIGGREIENFPIRGFLIYPNLLRSAF